MRQALHCLTLLLLSGLAPERTFAGSRQRSAVRTIGDWPVPELSPYLSVIGAPGLRFREPEVAPEPAPPPVAIGPPVPGLNAAESAVAVANAAALRVPMADDAIPGQASARAPQSAVTPPVSAKPVPPAILPDDIGPRVRVEDFLPFFQIPGAAQSGDTTAVPSSRGGPGPAPLPSSSATYTRTPK